MALEFFEGEEIVLDDGQLGFRKKLTLTNKRLIIQKCKGVFSVSWEQESEIPLEEIGTNSNLQMMLPLKILLRI